MFGFENFEKKMKNKKIKRKIKNKFKFNKLFLYNFFKIK